MSLVNKTNQIFFDKLAEERKAITFDEVTFQDIPSDIHPNDVGLETNITIKYRIKSCGILSSPMDTVTEEKLALEMAKNGGVGIIHRNMSADRQSKMIKWVRNKIHMGGMIDNPITYLTTNSVADVENDIKKNGWTFTNFPILDKNNILKGMVSRNELDFVETSNPKLQDIMIPFESLVITHETNNEIAYKLMQKYKVKKLPVIKKDNNEFVGLYAWDDIRKDKSNKKLFSLDEEGHFLIGAAVGVGENEKERVKCLMKANCKLIVIDTSHGACKPVIEMLDWIKDNYTVQVIVGNVASYESTKYICQSGKYKPDGIRCGISIGSICTTRRVTAHGMPQLTAINRCWTALRDLNLTNIPIIADGGIKFSGDIVKSIAVGASGVMMGNIFAGTDESPSKLVVSNGQKYKMVRGMASRSAMENREGSRSRYFNDTSKSDKLTNKQKIKIVPEGVDGLTKYRGSVEKVITELIGGVRSGLAHSNGKNIDTFRKNCLIWIQSNVGVREGNPHSLVKILDC